MDDYTPQPEILDDKPLEQKRFYYKGGLNQEEYDIKSGIRSEAAGIAVSLLILIGISTFWSQVYFLIMSKLGYSHTEAYSFISEPAVAQLCQIVLSAVLFTVPFIFVQKIKGRNISELVPIKRVEKSKILPMFFIGTAFCAFSNIVCSELSRFFDDVEYEVARNENPQGFFGFLLVLTSTVIVPALAEEFACRGIILTLLRKFGDKFAIIVSAALFGLGHRNFEQIPFAFLAGLVLGYIVVKTGSIVIAVAVHAANNLISLCYSYLNDVIPELRNASYLIVLCVLMLLGIVTIMSQKNVAELIIIDSGDKTVSEGKKYKWFFSSAWIIIFIVLCGIHALSYF